MTLFARVVDQLHKLQIPFVVIGASALAAHGVSRSTFDIDLLVMDARVLDRRVWRMRHVLVDVRPGDQDDPLAGVVRIRAAGNRDVDLVVGREAWQADLLSPRWSVELEGARVPVVDAAGLILLKLYAGGVQDSWDIEQLLAAGDRATLISEVDQQVHVLATGPRAQWQQLRAG